ncbi:MAG: glycosyltransferase family 2 protein, partial [Fibrobacteres bacterium]|nr:glycosyltransferase family 2 protein [Fibrobacterota bacterium]
MAQPLFTVVVPTHKRLDSLKQTIAAINVQTLSNDLFDVVVVNDGEDPATSKWLAENSINFLAISQSGPATARNKGAASAAGKFIAFTDDDALPEKEWLQSAAEYLKMNPAERVLEGPVVADGKPAPLTHYINHSGAGGFLTCNLIVEKSLFEKADGFNTAFLYPMNEDYDFALRIQKLTPIKFVEKMKVVHPVRKLSFLKVFSEAATYVSRRVASDRILYELHTEEYRFVKAKKTSAETLKRQAMLYLFDEIRKTDNKLKHPFR